MTQEERWILEKYTGEKSTRVFDESFDEIKNKYSWGEDFFADVQRLEAGEPLAYIIGATPFLQTTIYLDSRPLIPRVETEFWVSEAIETITGLDMPHPRILDLCAGSGCIGVAMAKAFPDATVHFAEIDEEHHATIAKNIRENSIGGITAIFGGHLFAQAQPFYDVILCNPPYIQNGSEQVQESVRKYEPSLALYGGEDGTDLIQEIIANAPRYLTSQGILYIEHEPKQSDFIEAYAAQNNMKATTHTDQYGIPRYTEFHMAQ